MESVFEASPPRSGSAGRPPGKETGEGLDRVRYPHGENPLLGQPLLASLGFPSGRCRATMKPTAGSAMMPGLQPNCALSSIGNIPA